MLLFLQFVNICFQPSK